MTVILHEDVPLEVAVEVVRAIDFWEEACSCELFVDEGEVGLGAIIVVLPAPPEMARHYAGMANKAGSTVGVYIDFKAPNVPRVIAHEFGHALGLPHNSDIESVMYFMALPGEFFAKDEDVANIPAH
jgi:hypothetical protein